jgi:hypothetical protein
MLKFAALLVVNLVIAIVGITIVDTPLRRMLSPDSLSALVWKECVLSIVFAAFFGFGIWRIWPNPAANWTWVLPAVWFTIAWVFIAGTEGFGPILWFGSGREIGPAEIRSFFAFTVPLIRAVFYSVGAFISSRLQPDACPISADK